MRIARKEAKESQKWIQLLVSIEMVKSSQVENLLQEAEEICKILYSIVKTSEGNN